MENRSQNSAIIEDERIQAITNKYAANAFNFLTYYLVFSIIFKSFTLDENIFLYYDYGIAMVIGAAFMIYRSANEGVAYSPSALKVFNAGYIKGFSMTSLLFGLFVTFVISGMDERMAAFFSGVFEKLIGAVIIGVIFFAIMILSAWLIDILPTKLAFRKAAEMTDEPHDDLPDEEEVVKQNNIKDERIDSTIEKYAAHAFYFVFGYILISSTVKFFIPGLSLIVFYDALLAAIVTAVYFHFNILNAGAYHEPELSKEDVIKNRMISVITYLAFGIFTSFILFPESEALLHSTGHKIAFGLLLAVLFGIGMFLIGKVSDRYAKRRFKKLIDK